MSKEVPFPEVPNRNPHWESDAVESEVSDSEDEDQKNDTPLKGMDPKFRKGLVDIKNALYDSTVYSKKEGTPESHDMKLLQDYIGQLNHLYIISIDAQKIINNVNDDSQLEVFPIQLRDTIKGVLVWISTYFSKNGREDTLPYSRAIEEVLHENTYVQH
jgi:hypothetical protein